MTDSKLKLILSSIFIFLMFFAGLGIVGFDYYWGAGDLVLGVLLMTASSLGAMITFGKSSF